MSRVLVIQVLFGVTFTLASPLALWTEVRWFTVAESTIRWFIVREKHCWMTTDLAE
jgi:hypothetical protein